LQRFDKPSSLSRRLLASDAAYQRCGDISMNRPAGVIIRKWRAYFSAYAAEPGDLLC
jgi:predicted transcriptional regulator